MPVLTIHASKLPPPPYPSSLRPPEGEFYQRTQEQHVVLQPNIEIAFFVCFVLVLGT